MTVNCDYCDSSLDPLTGKCPMCEDIASEESLDAMIDEEYIEPETDLLDDVFEVDEETLE